MAIAHVQSTKKVSTVVANNTTTLAYGSNLTAGNFIINSLALFDGTSAPTIQTPTDTLSHVYAAATAEQALGAALRMRSYYKENCSAGACTVTFDALETGGDMTMTIAEFSGMATASAIDKTMVGTDTSGTSSSVDSGNTAATTQADELVYGCMMHDSGSNLTITETGSASLLQENEGGAANMPIAASYKIISATGAQKATWTLSAGAQWAAHVATFKGAAAAGPTVAQTIGIFDQQLSSGLMVGLQWK